MPAKFIVSEAAIAAAIQTLNSIGNDSWHRLYRDPKNGQVWYLTEYDDWEPEVPQSLRSGNPSVEDTLEFIARSNELHAVAAAAYYLTTTHPARKENIEALVRFAEDALVQDGTPETSERLATALVWADADTPFNHRPVTGKPYSEIEADYNHFKELAARAAALIAAAGKRVGHTICKSAYVP